MSGAIKAGDLVMVVRPTICCGYSGHIGRTGTAEMLPGHVVRVACTNCGHRDLSVASFFAIGLVAYQASRLKKIDPPSEGDSLPTRRDIEQRA